MQNRAIRQEEAEHRHLVRGRRRRRHEQLAVRDLAGRLELGAVRSRVLRFDDEIAIVVVVDRFDRGRGGPGKPYRSVSARKL